MAGVVSKKRDGQEAPADVGVAAPPAPALPPGEPTKPVGLRYRVWTCGSLWHDGCEFQPGEEVPLTEAEVKANGLDTLGVLVPIAHTEE